MTKRIKGITIEIDGDTKGLDKSLSDVDKRLTTTKDDLKDVNKLLKLDPRNTELLKQKQDLLSSAINDTKDRLSQLETALSQMDAAGVDKNSEAYRGLQREIADTENKLKSLEDQMKDFGSVGAQQIANVGKKFQEVGGKISDVGGAMTKGVTAPIAAAAGASVAAWKEVDEAMDTIVTKTGASGEALSDMQDRAKSIAETIPTSFQTAADAVGEVNTRFGLTGDELEDLSTQFVEFADINNTDVSTSIDQVQKVLDAYGIASSYAGTQLDVLNRVGQNTGISMDTLTNDLVQNAAAFQEMGMNSNQAAVFIGQVEKSGIDTSTMMSGLSKALKNATADGTSMNDALAELQDQILNGTDSTDGLTDAYDLFGKSGAAVYNAVLQGSIDFTQLADAADIVQDSMGSVADTAENTRDPLDQMTMVVNNLKDLGAEIVDASAPMLTAALTDIKDTVTGLKDAWDGLSPGMQEAIVKAALIAAAVGPVLVVLGNVITSIGTIMTMAPKVSAGITTIKGLVGNLGTGLQSLWGVITANPILAIIALIAALVAAFIHFWNTSEEFRNFWIGLWQSITSTVSGFASSIASIWQSVLSNIQNVWNSITNSISNALNNIGNTIRSGLGSARNFISNTLGSIKNTFSSIWDGCRSVVQRAIDRIKGMMNFSWSLPHLRLPHVSISGGFSLVPPRVPSFSVNWYAKGGILTSPTIFGMQNSSLLGGGEAGPEAVLPIEKLKEYMSEIMDRKMEGGGNTFYIYANPGMDTTDLANKVEDIINRKMARTYKAYE